MIKSELHINKFVQKFQMGQSLNIQEIYFLFFYSAMSSGAEWQTVR